MILEPNRQRRRRMLRVIAMLGLIAVVGAVLASGWTLPALSIATATPTASPFAQPTASEAVAVIPSATPEPTSPPPSLAPTPGPDGCLPPPSDAQPASLVSHGSRTDKVVALTFDDGNNPENVEKILYILYSRHVNATFFPTARAIELAPKTWQHVVQTGYPIGNHTYHHASLKGQCFDKQVAELDLAKAVEADHGVTIQPIMRPPYEEFDDNTRLAAMAAGESNVVLWDVDTQDWTGISRLSIVSRALHGKNGSIILMHTTRPETASALYLIIEKYRARGYRFVTVGQLLGIPGPAPFSPPQ